MKTIVKLLAFLWGVTTLCGLVSCKLTDVKVNEKSGVETALYEKIDASYMNVEPTNKGNIAPCSTQILGVKSISVECPPHKTVYKAFERFSGDGLVVSVHYENGTSERIGAESLEVIYANGKCFLAGDTSVTLSYGGRRATVGVTVKKADYDMSGVSFVPSEYIYDGETHYPKIKGRMPEGEDGIALEYSFLAGATHVDEGNVDVVVSFSTASKNYNTPSNMKASVKILPRGINVIWGETELEYNGNIVCPTVYAKETELEVYSEAINVGRYFAIAVSKNNDYYVIDDRCEFTVSRAKNFWETPPEATECYEGKTPELRGKARFGNVEFSFFADYGCKKRITPPFGVGTYYAVATVSETANYSSLSSEPFSFRVVEIVPVGLSVKLLRENLVAHTQLSGEDYSISLLYNDGSETPIDKTAVKVIYENGEGLRQADKTVKFKWDIYEKTLDVSVNYADYDLSGVMWQDTEQIYDGKPKCPSLTGLPQGITVKEYIGGGVNAGKYTVSAVIEYDAENFNRPNIEDCSFTVKKQTVKAPIIETVYNSEPQSPISTSALYRVITNDSFEGVGEYPIRVELTDPANFMFEDGDSKVGIGIFKVTPRTVSVKVDKVMLHLFERFREASYTGLTEGLIYGDKIDVEQKIEGGRVILISLDPNYRIDSLGGEITRLPYPTLLGGILLFAVLGMIAVFVYALINKKERLKDICAILRCRWRNRRMVIYPPRPMQKRNHMTASTQIPTEKTTESDAQPQTEENDTTSEEITVIGFGVDVERADSLITDSLAKDLLKKDGEVICTSGSEKATVTVEELNDNFAMGDRVDINVLKEKKLIPEDTLYIKVVAAGTLDKALTVYANDFTLTAIKMISLEGGDAIKAATVREKNDADGEQATEE